MNLVLWLSWGSAQAKDPSCPELYVWQFKALIAAVDEEYTNLEFRRAQMLLDAAGPRVPCVVQIVPTDDLAEFALRRAYAFALDLDENEAQRWAQLAFSLKPGLDWPVYVPPDHAARSLLEGMEALAPLTIEGAGLVVPQAGGAFVDGRFVEVPKAEPGVPHLLQVGDGAGTLVFSDWIDGATFPDELLGPVPETPLTLPRWYSPDGKIKRAPRPWTPARLHRLESSAGFALAAGALYGTALLARSAYTERATDGLLYTTNGAVIASGASGSAAVVLFGAALFGK
jgi:hypothetical protein